MTRALAALPMYDWPELRPATDRLWAAIRCGLRRAGVAAPEALSRGGGLMAGWTDPGLVLGQTCGLPFVRELAGRVALVGTPDYGVPGCAAGWYRSAVLVRAEDRRTMLADFRGARLAINGTDSQSGWGSILHHAAPLAEGGWFFGSVVVSGAHVASVPMVAGGAADLAAIDFVSWRYCQRFVSEAARLRVLMLTEPTPGLPFIAPAGTETRPHADAVEAAIEELDRETRAELGLIGFARLEAKAYRVIARRMAVAMAALAGEAFVKDAAGRVPNTRGLQRGWGP